MSTARNTEVCPADGGIGLGVWSASRGWVFFLGVVVAIVLRAF